MKVKLAKAQWANIVEVNDDELEVEGLNHTFKCGKHTKNDFLLDNMSTADIELLTWKYPNLSVSVKSRYVKNYVDSSSPYWRG